MDGSAEQARRDQWRRARPVRAGDTMWRPPHRRASYVDGLLRHLIASGFEGVPRPLGYDEQGRQILTFIEGEVVDRPTDAQIRSATGLIRVFHDATAGSPFRADRGSRLPR